MATLIRSNIYLFRGQQLRYSHQSRNAFIFISSDGKRRELSQEIVQKELQATRILANQ
jgi:hypothetical protein